MKVRIESGGSFRNTRIHIDGQEITRAVSVTFRMDTTLDMPVIDLVLAPEHIEIDSAETRAVMQYADPITGERFERVTPLPERDDA